MCRFMNELALGPSPPRSHTTVIHLKRTGMNYPPPSPPNPSVAPAFEEVTLESGCEFKVCCGCCSKSVVLCSKSVVLCSSLFRRRGRCYTFNTLFQHSNAIRRLTTTRVIGYRNPLILHVNPACSPVNLLLNSSQNRAYLKHVTRLLKGCYVAIITLLKYRKRMHFISP